MDYQSVNKSIQICIFYILIWIQQNRSYATEWQKYTVFRDMFSKKKWHGYCNYIDNRTGEDDRSILEREVFVWKVR